ncbi:MAG: hypothetical protein Q4G42_06460 [Neisseria sp.]|nr:hypothetical protein [Neisseria sp.]
MPHGQLTFFASSKKVSKERRPHGAGFGFAKTSRSKSRLCGGLELVSAAPPLKQASPFLRKNGFLNGCFKGLAADEIFAPLSFDVVDACSVGNHKKSDKYLNGGIKPTLRSRFSCRQPFHGLETSQNQPTSTSD